MPRTYSDKLILLLSADESNHIGKQLGRVCVKANLPMLYVAEALGVSRMTLFNWFRGGVVRASFEPSILAFIALVEKDTEDGKLPANGFRFAKKYIETMIGREIT